MSFVVGGCHPRLSRKAQAFRSVTTLRSAAGPPLVGRRSAGWSLDCTCFHAHRHRDCSCNVHGYRNLISVHKQSHHDSSSRSIKWPARDAFQPALVTKLV